MKPSFVATLAFGILLPCIGLSLAVRAQEAPAPPPAPVTPVDPKLEAEKAASVKALQNVKTLSVACLMNAADSGDTFKIGPSTFKKDVGPYVKDMASFTSPLDKPGTASYQFNKALQNVPMKAIKKPAQTVMIYDGQWGKPAFRYHGMALIGFADGHVKMFGPATAKNLLWKP